MQQNSKCRRFGDRDEIVIHIKWMQQIDTKGIKKQTCMGAKDDLLEFWVTNRSLNPGQFELQSRYYILFRTHALGKSMNQLFKLCKFYSSRRMALVLNKIQRLICQQTKKLDKTLKLLINLNKIDFTSELGTNNFPFLDKLWIDDNNKSKLIFFLINLIMKMTISVFIHIIIPKK